jgi:hypothetical protein
MFIAARLALRATESAGLRGVMPAIPVSTLVIRVVRPLAKSIW